MTERYSSDQLYQSAKDYLTSINERLMIKCPDYRISLNFYSEIQDKEINSYAKKENLKDKNLLLCLFHHDACVSSLILDTEKDKDGLISISIDSKTKEDYQKRNFNKFLKAIVVKLAEFINPDVKFVISYAHNPLSAIKLIKYFDVTAYNMYDNDPIHGFEEDVPINYDRNKLVSLLNNSTSEFGLIIKVELNNRNKEKADAIINKLIEGSELICGESDTLTRNTSHIGGKNIKTLKDKKKRKTTKKTNKKRKTIKKSNNKIK